MKYISEYESPEELSDEIEDELKRTLLKRLIDNMPSEDLRNFQNMTMSKQCFGAKKPIYTYTLEVNI